MLSNRGDADGFSVAVAMALLFAMIGLGLGHSLGFNKATETLSKKAIDAGVGFYEPDPVTGKPVFQFRRMTIEVSNGD